MGQSRVIDGERGLAIESRSFMISQSRPIDAGAVHTVGFAAEQRDLLLARQQPGCHLAKWEPFERRAVVIVADFTPDIAGAIESNRPRDTIDNVSARIDRKLEARDHFNVRERVTLVIAGRSAAKTP